MGKKVRLMAGAAGMVPALGLAPAAAAASPAAAVHTAGKRVFLQAGQAAAKCTGKFGKTARASSSSLVLSVSHKGDCVLGIIGQLRINESPGSLSGDLMHIRAFNDGVRVFTDRATFFDSSGDLRAADFPGVIAHRVCVTAFSQDHPAKKIAGPVCVKF